MVFLGNWINLILPRFDYYLFSGFKSLELSEVNRPGDEYYT